VKDIQKIALIGNPNVGKSTLFNQLTGLHQKIGNYPGVTVDKLSGQCTLPTGKTVEIIDLPGTYSLYPKSPDETIVLQEILNPAEKIDGIIFLADATHLKRSLLLFTQLYDLAIPIVLVINKIDVAENKQIFIDMAKLKTFIPAPVVEIHARAGKGVDELKKVLATLHTQPATPKTQFLPVWNSDFIVKNITAHPNPPSILEGGNEAPLQNGEGEGVRLPSLPTANSYVRLHYLHQGATWGFLSTEEKSQREKCLKANQFDSQALQSQETLARYEIISDWLKEVVRQEKTALPTRTKSQRIDSVLLHPLGGYVIFLGLLFLLFQGVFTLAEYPKGLIEFSMAWLQQQTKATLPEGVFTSLLADGILAGIGGILVFVPQIAVLFLGIGFLEESGYMARAVVLMDRLLRPLGLNGRSVVPLISGLACAVPAIMATRTIQNVKERLITILVTPFMSCSARLPVYTTLIALVVPNDKLWGLFGLQGLTLLAMYVWGVAMALISAVVFKWILKSTQISTLILELPSYQMPSAYNLAILVWEKSFVFVREAGKVILAISVVLWVLASYGWGDGMAVAEKQVRTEFKSLPKAELDLRVASARLEYSFAGQFGKLIEPAIAPIGYDWKIGIALITSFAAREVFVGTLATIYSVGDVSEDIKPLTARLQAERNPKTQKKVYTMATAFSLMVFYAFALQCMSTIAIVYRETKGWKYPLIQLVYMTALAYLGAWLTFWWWS
jgi:ferrous iron transport protein B